MRNLSPFIALVALSLASCAEVKCVDCSDTQGTIFTFCDPAVSPLDSLTCGEIYTSRK